MKEFAKHGRYCAGTYTGNLLADDKIFANGSGQGVWKPAGGQMTALDTAVRRALRIQIHAVSRARRGRVDCSRTTRVSQGLAGRFS